MGYAQMHQRGQGIHLRQYSRAFIIEKDGKRVVFVSVDGAMITHPLKRDVSKQNLKERTKSIKAIQIFIFCVRR